MINPKRLLQMARKWHMIAVTGRRRISTLRTYGSAEPKAKTKSVVEKGHFVIYTTDGMRFAFPLEYLTNAIFKELLEMSEEEYGLPRNGPITIPCDSAFMKQIVSLVLQRRASKDVERSMLASIAASRCSASTSAHGGMTHQQILIHGF